MKLVYFLRRADGTGPIKIGCSSCPETRRKQISTDLKTATEIIAAVPGDFIAERNVHLKFAHLREAAPQAIRNGRAIGPSSEWFRPAPDLLAFVEGVADEGALPLSIDDQREWIFAKRYLAGETLKQIGDDYGITRERVRQVLRNLGVPSLGFRAEHRRKAHDLTLAERRAAKMYESGTSPREIMQLTGFAHHQILESARRCGIRIKPRGSWLVRADDVELTTRVCELYQRGFGPKQIVEAVPQVKHPQTIYRYLRKGGVAVRNGTGRNKLEVHADAIILAYHAGARQADLAEQFDCSNKSIAALLRRRGAQLPHEERERRRILAVIEANKRRSSTTRAEA